MPLHVRAEPTPNPNAMRLALSAPVLGDRPRSFGDAAAAAAEPWAARLLAIPGVVSVFALRDFLTITKTAGGAWEAILPKALEVVAKDLS